MPKFTMPLQQPFGQQRPQDAPPIMPQTRPMDQMPTRPGMPMGTIQPPKGPGPFGTPPGGPFSTPGMPPGPPPPPMSPMGGGGEPPMHAPREINYAAVKARKRAMDAPVGPVAGGGGMPPPDASTGQQANAVAGVPGMRRKKMMMGGE